MEEEKFKEYGKKIWKGEKKFDDGKKVRRWNFELCNGKNMRTA